MKTYDMVKSILLRDEGSRNSDKRLMFKVWELQNLNTTDYLSWMETAAHPKSIIESRRNLQREQEAKLEAGEGIPTSEWIIANKQVKKFRELIDQQKGTHIFREDDGQGQLI